MGSYLNPGNSGFSNMRNDVYVDKTEMISLINQTINTPVSYTHLDVYKRQDYDGSYGYMITDHCIRNGNDLMLGFNSAESNKLTDESATAVLAMRQACKNILYTVANSGYYADGNPAAGMSNMTKLFVTVDVILAVLLIAADAIVIVRFRKKRKNVDNAEA